jgi:hypothetical protein
MFSRNFASGIRLSAIAAAVLVTAPLPEKIIYDAFGK